MTEIPLCIFQTDICESQLLMTFLTFLCFFCPRRKTLIDFCDFGFYCFFNFKKQREPQLMVYICRGSAYLSLIDGFCSLAVILSVIFEDADFYVYLHI